MDSVSTNTVNDRLAYYMLAYLRRNAQEINFELLTKSWLF